ncbi:MAG: NADH-quinone oxidoreductase subunit NuoF [Vicinamibacterales bacterium]|nr:NADH-quinone oxidoreductase subunit NuoF [Vicinamibacterales bacterium]
MSEANGTRTLLVCKGTGCISSGATPVHEALREKLGKTDLTGIQLKFTGCHGFCQRGPIVIVEPDGIFYAAVAARDVPEIIESQLKANKPVERLFYKDPVTGAPIKLYKDIPFYSGQTRMILRNCGHINPEDIQDSIDVGVYTAVKRVLREMKPQDVIDVMKKSRLRGRGGAGFPAGNKWQFCHDTKADQKYVVCNGDEGDPGAFMDRSILEATPHQVIEGMIIAGYAVGASKGIFYVRAEYPLAVSRVRIALAQAREKGFLGTNILGSGFDFDLEIFQGAGAFVCGEETALIASLEGRRGMPRTRPPFPAIQGLLGKPTLINNVKSLTYVAEIIQNGAEWFTGIGTEKSPGTAVFALTGEVANCGLVEVAMGTPLRDIIFNIGGGITDGKKFKAVQTGGPSGGCLPEAFLETPVDYERLAAAGSIMGSGGMVVMNEDTCMVDVARYFLDFTQKESCGKCVPCRMGTRHMLLILERLCAGEGRESDIDTLGALAEGIIAGSLCGLGQTAPNPVLTTIKYFRHEYEAHVREKRCPALKCKALLEFSIDMTKCPSCGVCVRNCPSDAITGNKKAKEPFVVHAEKCIMCGMCLSVCKFDAVIKTSPGIAVSGVPPTVGASEETPIGSASGR